MNLPLVICMDVYSPDGRKFWVNILPPSPSPNWCWNEIRHVSITDHETKVYWETQAAVNVKQESPDKWYERVSMAYEGCRQASGATLPCFDEVLLLFHGDKMMSEQQCKFSIEEIAKMVHEVNRSYCFALGDDSQPPWEAAPDWQRVSCLQGVEFHVQHPGAQAWESHDNWLQEKARDGWVYGPVKDAEKKEHPCIVPFHKLPQEQQAKDFLFSGVVNACLKL